MNWFLVDRWPWWLGALGLSTVTLGLWIIERRLLGVSGSYGSVVSKTQPAKAATATPTPGPNDPPILVPIITKPPLPRTVHITFLIALIAGGALPGLLTGTWGTHRDLGATHLALFGSTWMLPILLVGGILTGIGSRMAGGCTSGHGLSGCSRMRPVSFVATMAYFGTGVMLSFLLTARIS